MVKVIFYGKERKYAHQIHKDYINKEVDRGIFKSEDEAKLKALALNWRYMVVAEY
jgi:hypothetical protein